MGKIYANAFSRLSLFFVLLTLSTTGLSQSLLAGWTFDGLPATPGTPTSVAATLGIYNTTSSLLANGENGASTWLQASELNSFAGTTANDPRTPASASSEYGLLGGTGTSANGKAIVFKTSTIGYKNIRLSMSLSRTSTGFTTHAWSYSTNGTSYTNIGSTTTPTTGGGVVTLDLTSIDAIENQANVYLRLTVSGASGGTGNNRFDNVRITSDNKTWFGVTNTSFSTASNWVPSGLVSSLSTAPSTGDHINFTGSPTNAPSITAATSVGDVTYLQSASSILFAGSFPLTVNGNISNLSGNVQRFSADVWLAGSTAQTIGGNSKYSFTNLVINNTSASGVTLADSVRVLNKLSFEGNNNNKKLTTGGFLILSSTSSATARLADLTNNGVNTGNTIVGTVTVERYIPARRSWKLLTAPVRGVGSSLKVFGQWQNNGVVNGNGAEIWGPDGTNPVNGVSGNGLASAPNASYSMKKYDAATNTLVDVKNTALEDLATATGGFDNKSFFLFLTGPFANGNGNIAPVKGASPTVMRATGQLQTGDINIPINSQRFTVMGNPYASPVDFTKVYTNTGVSSKLRPRFWVWDAQHSTFGAYKLVYRTNTGTMQAPVYEWKMLPANPYLGNASSALPAGDLIHIQSGQAVFLENKTVGTPNTVTLKETNKSAPATLTQIFRTASAPTQEFGVSLFKEDEMVDGTLVQFSDAFSANPDDEEDAGKPSNTNENIAVRKTMDYVNSLGRTLMMDARAPITANDTVYLWTWNLTVGQPYKLVFSLTEFAGSSLSAFLLDSYTNTSTPISLTALTEYTFTPSTAGGTNPDLNRFKVVFSPVTILPLSFTSVKASKVRDVVKVEWKVSREINVDHYEIEKSTDGSRFSASGNQKAKSNGADAIYSWNDQQFSGGHAYYRIKAVEKNGSSKYSAIVKVSADNSNDGLIVAYPNPVSTMQFALQLSLKQGLYSLRIINAAGQVVAQQVVNHPGGNVAETFQLPSNAAKGMYTIEVSKDEQKYSTPLLFQ